MTQDELKEILDYDPETGVFRWKVYKNQHTKIGDVAGTINSNGYRFIKINGKSYHHRNTEPGVIGTTLLIILAIIFFLVIFDGLFIDKD